MTAASSALAPRPPHSRGHVGTAQPPSARVRSKARPGSRSSWPAPRKEKPASPLRASSTWASCSRTSARNARSSMHDEGYGRGMLLDSLHLDAAAFEAGTGWAIKPEGACRGDVCVPLPVEARADGDVDVEVVAQRLGMPLVAGDGPDV